MNQKRRNSRSTGRRRLFIVLGVVALIVVDAALVMFALSHGSKPDLDASAPTSFPSAPAGTPLLPESTPVPTQEPGASQPATGSTTTEIAPRLLALSSDGTWYRATPGSCSTGGGELEVSNDAGVNWAAAGLGFTEVSSYFQIVPSTSGRADVVFADADCGVMRADTFVAGAEWREDPDGLGAPTYVDEEGVLTVTGEQVASPCALPRSVNAFEGSVAVVCNDGLFEQQNGGAWRTVQVSGVLAVAAIPSGWVIAREGVEGCDGISLESLGLGADETFSISCTVPAEIASVTIGANATTVGLWSGDEMFGYQL